MEGDSWVVVGPQIIEVDDVRAVRVALVGGRADVVGRDEPGARIEVHRVDGRPLEVSLVAQTRGLSPRPSRRYRPAAG